MPISTPAFRSLCAALAFLPLSLAAHAETPRQSPEQFLSGIYAHYTSGKENFEPLGKEGEQLFERSLFLLIQKDALSANGKGEVPLLNGDPICNCQEYHKLKNLTISAPESGNPHPLASVSFSNEGKKETMQYELVPSNDTWKIYDIITPEDGSLREYLSKGLADEKGTKE